MALLPLFRCPPMTEAGVMSSTNSPSTGSRSSGRRSWPQLLRSVSLKVAEIVTECNRATRMMTELRLAPDRYVPDATQAPGDYAEFLFRTSGPLRHEPSARQRAAGRSLR